MKVKPVLGILLGDAAGVGPEIVAKLVVNGFLTEHCRPLLIGDYRVLQRAFQIIGAGDPTAFVGCAGDAEARGKIPMIDQGNCDPAQVPFATATVMAGTANVDGMDIGVELYRAGKIAGFCFGPFNKAMLKEDPRMEKADGSHYESEHHYIAHLLGHTAPFGEINAVGRVWTTRTTSHIPVKDVSEHLTPTSIGRAIELMYTTLRHAGVVQPRIAVAALNPHAGENGTCGREEIDVITPAIAAANERYHTDRITGPYPSDTLLWRLRRRCDDVPRSGADRTEGRGVR